MNKIIIVFISYIFLTAAPIAAISLSLASDINTYMQVYDSLGAIIFADFVIPNDTKKIETGGIQIDRVRWLGIDKRVYEYRFEKVAITDKILFQLSKNNVCTVGKIDPNGMISSGFSYSGTMLYDK